MCDARHLRPEARTESCVLLYAFPTKESDICRNEPFSAPHSETATDSRHMFAPLLLLKGKKLASN